MLILAGAMQIHYLKSKAHENMKKIYDHEKEQEKKCSKLKVVNAYVCEQNFQLNRLRKWVDIYLHT
jgi:hypothetical protein